MPKQGEENVETILIISVMGAIFMAGAAIGQLLLKIRLSKLQKQSLEMEKKRLEELKKLVKARSKFIEHQVAAGYEQAVRDEINQILGDIECK